MLTSTQATYYTRIDVDIDSGVIVLLAALTLYLGYGKHTPTQQDLARDLIDALSRAHPQKDIHIIMS